MNRGWFPACEIHEVPVMSNWNVGLVRKSVSTIQGDKPYQFLMFLPNSFGCGCCWVVTIRVEHYLNLVQWGRGDSDDEFDKHSFSLKFEMPSNYCNHPFETHNWKLHSKSFIFYILWSLCKAFYMAIRSTENLKQWWNFHVNDIKSNL